MNDFRSYILHNQLVLQLCQPSIIVSAAFMGKNAMDDIATAFWKSLSMELQWFLVLHHG